MAQVPIVDTRLDAPGVAKNRISLPFLRVQERKWLLACIDTLAAAGWLLAAYEIWRVRVHPAHGNMPSVPWAWVVGGALGWVLASWLAGAYELDTADRFLRAARSTATASVGSLIAGLAAYYAFLKTYPRPALGLALIAVPATILAWRALYASILRRPASAVRLLFVGNPALFRALMEAATGREGYYRLLGFVSEHPIDHPLCLGGAEELGGLAVRLAAHRIVVAPRQSLPTALITMLSECIERGIEVVDFNSAYEEMTEKVAVEHAGDYWLAALPTRPTISSFEEVAMRLLDIAGAVAGLAVTSVLTPVVVLCIVLESGRPVIYRQERLGRGGKPFTIYKFRSMRPDAELHGPTWAVKGDRRVTRVGRLLRRTHLDELPQFWNVLRGDMSLVGPRPERPGFIAELGETIPFYRLRLAVRPGLSGLKQIRVGYAASAEEHLEVLRHDLYYIKHRSLTLNLLVIARTVGTVLGLKGR